MHLLQSRECLEDKLLFNCRYVRGYHEYQSVWQAALGGKLKFV